MGRGPAASDFGTAKAQWPRAAPPVKFLTVRNLITRSPRRSYDCVSANSLQWLQALHGSASASLSESVGPVRRTCHWIKHWNAGRRPPSLCEERAGEGWGEGKSNKNAPPLPGPLRRRRRKGAAIRPRTVAYPAASRATHPFLPRSYSQWSRPECPVP